MNLSPVVLKFQFVDLTCRTAFLLALLLAAPVLGQEASNIDSFEAATVSLEFPSSDGDYHLVQASRDLKKWVIVGQYPGNGQAARFKDLRSQLGETHFTGWSQNLNRFRMDCLTRSGSWSPSMKRTRSPGQRRDGGTP